MCGIAAVLDLHGDAEHLRHALARGVAVQRHRGPDDEGLWLDGPVGLGFRRLAILDVSPEGHQPMTSHDGAWTVVFNGEIYNYGELGRELGRHGVQLRSHCDTEVLVEALALWGIDCFARFNGMWAVVAWHAPTQTLYACRDPWGIKPLFFCGNAGRWVGFASEIGGLRAMGCDLGGVDGLAARRFLTYGELDVDTRTMFSRVHRLKPGELYTFQVGQPLRRTPYPDGTAAQTVPKFAAGPAGEAEFIEAFRDTLIQSVRLRLRSDVPVGVCLSGGLDSAAIACIAARFLDDGAVQQCRNAFTATMPEFDETTYVRRVIEQTRSAWHITVASDQQVLRQFTRFFDAHAEPVHSLSPLVGFLVMSLAPAEGVKVLLNGQGSDELLAGYPSSVLPYLRTLLVDHGVVESWPQAMQEATDPLSGTQLLAHAGLGMALRELPWPTSALMRRVLAARARRVDLALDDGPLGVQQVRPLPPSQTLAEQLHDQLTRSPLPLYLRIEDTNSSLFSLEARLPFLDPRLVAVARATPAHLLRRQGLNKYLLRRALQGVVPDVVWQRRTKFGFPVPHERWLRGPLRAVLTETLSPEAVRARGWYSPRVPELVQDFLRGAPLPAGLLRVFLLEQWAQAQLDRGAPKL
jgi:asparagine synthase (glutamine-hydrolysing)